MATIRVIHQGKPIMIEGFDMGRCQHEGREVFMTRFVLDGLSRATHTLEFYSISEVSFASAESRWANDRKNLAEQGYTDAEILLESGRA